MPSIGYGSARRRDVNADYEQGFMVRAPMFIPTGVWTHGGRCRPKIGQESGVDR